MGRQKFSNSEETERKKEQRWIPLILVLFLLVFLTSTVAGFVLGRSSGPDLRGQVIDTILLTPEAPPAEKIFHLYGRVFYSDGKPAAGRTLELRSDPVTAVSGTDGGFLFPNVPPGEHTISLLGEDGSAQIQRRLDIGHDSPDEGASIRLEGDGVYAINLSADVRVLEVMIELDKGELNIDTSRITYAVNDGTVVMPDGTSHTADGAVVTPGGNVYLPDGSIVFPGGGKEESANIILPDDTVVTGQPVAAGEAGEIAVSADGTVSLPDGTVIEPGGEIITPGDTGAVSEPSAEHAEESPAYAGPGATEPGASEPGASGTETSNPPGIVPGESGEPTGATVPGRPGEPTEPAGVTEPTVPGKPEESSSAAENGNSGGSSGSGGGHTKPTEPETPTESETPTEPESPTETEPESPTETEPESPTETEPESPTETEPETPTETEPESPTETEPESPTETEPESPTEPDNGKLAVSGEKEHSGTYEEWTQNCTVDLFYNRTVGAEDKIAPGSKGYYLFRLQNTRRSDLTVTVTLSEGSALHLPLTFSLAPQDGSRKKRAERTVLGALTEEKPLTLETVVKAGENNIYRLDWEWPLEGNDTGDTLIGTGPDHAYLLSMKIHAEEGAGAE